MINSSIRCIIALGFILMLSYCGTALILYKASGIELALYHLFGFSAVKLKLFWLTGLINCVVGLAVFASLIIYKLFIG